MNLLEMTIPELINSTENTFPDTDKRQNATAEVRVENVSFVPTSGGLMIKSEVVNTNKGSRYHTSVMIENVEFQETSSNETVTIKGSDGADHFIVPIDINTTDVKVNCTCLDFGFRFAIWNYNKDSLLGQKPEPYKKKPDSNRPPANPKQSPGVCKHLFKTFDELKTHSIFK